MFNANTIPRISIAMMVLGSIFSVIALSTEYWGKLDPTSKGRLTSDTVFLITTVSMSCQDKSDGNILSITGIINDNFICTFSNTQQSYGVFTLGGTGVKCPKHPVRSLTA